MTRVRVGLARSRRWWTAVSVACATGAVLMVGAAEATTNVPAAPAHVVRVPSPAPAGGV